MFVEFRFSWTSHPFESQKKWCRMWLTYLHDDDITCQCNVIFKDCNCENLGELKKSKNCKTDFQDSILNHTQPVLGEGYNQNFPMLLSLEIVPLIQAIGQWINFSSWCMTLFLPPTRFLVASYADILRLVTRSSPRTMTSWGGIVCLQPAFSLRVT